MSKYPESWGVNEIHYHETGELLCTHCFKYGHEDNMKKDVDGCDICEDCAKDIECYYCGSADRNVEKFAGNNVCPECMDCAVDDIDLTFGEDQRGDHAYFIHLKHFTGQWEVDEVTGKGINEPTFFRCLNPRGFDHRHGWLHGSKVIQWG